MNTSSFQTPFGLRDGKLIHVNDLPRGLDCGCVCPACGGALVARKGDIKLHHFAHAKGDNCAEAYETALHIAAKDILSEYKEIKLPAVEVKFTSYRKAIVLAPARIYELESVRLEKRIGQIIPDVLAVVGGKELIVEIRVTHAVDEEKCNKIRALNRSAIEIDLSDLARDTTISELKKHVVDASSRKTWLHNVVAEKYHGQLLSAAREVTPIQRGMASHIDGCPLPARIWKGKPYANLIDDCLDCSYALAIGGNIGGIVCAAFNPQLRDRIDDMDAVKTR